MFSKDSSRIISTIPAHMLFLGALLHIGNFMYQKKITHVETVLYNKVLINNNSLIIIHSSDQWHLLEESGIILCTSLYYLTIILKNWEQTVSIKGL